MTQEQPKALQLASIIDVCAEDPMWSNHTEISKKTCNAVSAELRRQHARIAELEAEIAAVGAGGVQALSAAPADEALRNVFDSLIEDLEERAERTNYPGNELYVLALREAISAIRPFAASPTPWALSGVFVTREQLRGWMQWCAQSMSHAIEGEIGELLYQSDATPPAEQQDLSQLTERGAVARAGVDAQALREGSHQTAPSPAELEQLKGRISRIGLDIDRALHGQVNEQSPVGAGRLAAIAALAAKPDPAPLSDDGALLDWLDQQREAYGFQDLHEGNRWEVRGAYSNLREAIRSELAALAAQGGTP